MKNTFGQSVAVTLFGESHGEMIGAVLDGLAPGLQVDEDFIRHQLSLRRPQGKISTPRVEADEFSIVSGVFEGKTTGTPLCILIPNTNTKSKDYFRVPVTPTIRQSVNITDTKIIAVVDTSQVASQLHWLRQVLLQFPHCAKTVSCLVRISRASRIFRTDLLTLTSRISKPLLTLRFPFWMRVRQT